MGIKEEVFYEGGPHIGDLILNILIGLTVVGLPLTVGAITRALWLRYRITNRRITVIGGWMGRDRTDIIHSEIVDIKKVARGIGLWVDMVVTLRGGSRLELRAIPKYREICDYVSQKAGLNIPKAGSLTGS